MDSDIISGAALTVALPLATLLVVVLYGFFVRQPHRRFGGISKSTALEQAGRPEIKGSDTNTEQSGGPVERPLG